MSFLKNYFSDLVVVECASVLAGPAVGMFFAELGAEVIKIENPSTNGDVTRGWKLNSENMEDDISAYFSSVNWGKKSIALDLKTDIGKATAKKIILKSDIFIQNFLPGDEKKYALDYKSLSKENPKLIYVQITAFGEKDKRSGFDAILQAETGFMKINGTPETDPIKMPVALIDVLLAHQVKEAVLLALMKRNHTGKGSFISSSLFQSGVASLINQAANYLNAGVIPERKGSDHPNISPYGTVFKTKDGKEIVIAAGTEKHFIYLCEALNIPGLAKDERFSRNHLRVKNNEELKAILKKEIIKLNAHEIIKRLEKANVPAGTVRNIKEVFEIDEAKKMVIERKLKNGRIIKGVNSISFNIRDNFNKKNMKRPPHLNEHKKEILKNL